MFRRILLSVSAIAATGATASLNSSTPNYKNANIAFNFSATEKLEKSDSSFIFNVNKNIETFNEAFQTRPDWADLNKKDKDKKYLHLKYSLSIKHNASSAEIKRANNKFDNLKQYRMPTNQFELHSFLSKNKTLFTDTKVKAEQHFSLNLAARPHTSEVTMFSNLHLEWDALGKHKQKDCPVVHSFRDETYRNDNLYTNIVQRSGKPEDQYKVKNINMLIDADCVLPTINKNHFNHYATFETTWMSTPDHSTSHYHDGRRGAHTSYDYYFYNPNKFKFKLVDSNEKLISLDINNYNSEKCGLNEGERDSFSDQEMLPINSLVAPSINSHINVNRWTVPIIENVCRYAYSFAQDNNIDKYLITPNQFGIDVPFSLKLSFEINGDKKNISIESDGNKFIKNKRIDSLGNVYESLNSEIFWFPRHMEFNPTIMIIIQDNKLFSPLKQSVQFTLGGGINV